VSILDYMNSSIISFPNQGRMATPLCLDPI
jgi:hypothetical protein